MKDLRRLRALLFALAAKGALGADPNLHAISQQWEQTMNALEQGRRHEAARLLEAFNVSARQYVKRIGRDWQIEYLAGSLYCRFPGQTAVGMILLNDVLQNGRDLSASGQAELRRDLSACTDTEAATGNVQYALRVETEALAHFQIPGIHGDMKGGYSGITAEADSGIRSTPKSTSELNARRFPVSEGESALNSALPWLQPNGTGTVVDGFAVVAPESAASLPASIGRCLSEYRQTMSKQFDLPPSEYIITVYALKSTNEVYNLARGLHGLDLPAGVVAYSVLDDMSLVGIGGTRNCGSMAHELLHLLIKRNFPLAPAWLEEGIASEVAVAVARPEAFQFIYSWRDKTLTDYWCFRPKVAELLDMPWSAFKASSSSDLLKVAAVQAMAAVFVRYLDEKGKLGDVYFGVRDKHLSSDMSQYRSYRDIVEASLSKNVNDVDDDFQSWFNCTTPTMRDIDLNGSISQTVVATCAASPHQ